MTVARLSLPLTLLVVAACSSTDGTASPAPSTCAPGCGGDAASTSSSGSVPPVEGGLDSGSGPQGGDAGDAATGVQDAAPDAVAPTPPASWLPVTGNLAGLSSDCGNMDGVYPDPTSDMLIAGVAKQGLWASTDGAASWHKLGTSGDTIVNRASAIVFDPAHPATFWESGIYGPGVFVTTDNGATFRGYGAASHNDSVAIDFTDPQRRTMLAGGHEKSNTLLLSTDAGQSWTNLYAKVPAGLGFCTTTAVIDAKTFLVGCAASWSGAAGAILRSTDGGGSFQQVSPKGVVGQPLRASDGAIHWAVEGGGIVTSTNGGATWTPTAAANEAGTLPPLELPDGRIVSSQGKSLVVSDKGASWTTIAGATIPGSYAPTGLSYSPYRNAFFIWYFTCSGANDVPADAILRFGWDYRK